ncbi:carboxy terminal-processing peptidase [Ichthyobacterium seriolicida]|uniref:Peptidase S41 n=1 Tax=Ichthyobacterium seriolicida TaxID=242600 RepID=A0A1J1DXA6_9FLAO|nr:carboxy terminal-processing peptidase [Ichthyobacterium seriolicida]BAV94465.1 peptidase S41 [Ichthyobacterium seriolicida]
MNNTRKTSFFRSAFIVTLFLGLFVFCSNNIGKSSYGNDDVALIKLIRQALDYNHYIDLKIDDTFSEKVFDKYLKYIDDYKRYLYKSDYDILNEYRYLIDDQYDKGSLDFFNLSYNMLTERIKESISISEEVLSKPFDFSKDEFINMVFVKDSINDSSSSLVDYVDSKEEMYERWRKLIKASVLQVLSNKLEVSSDEATDKKNDKDSKKSFETLEEESRQEFKKSLENQYKKLLSVEKKDYLSSYINSILSVYDPHTEYFRPVAKDKFDMSMSGQFEGIGAELSKQNGYVVITRIILGGPAWKQKKLEVGDKLLKITKPNGEQLDFSIVSLSESIKFIKGKKGTIAELTVQRVNGKIETVNIVRGVVKLEETFAKSSIIKFKGKTFGIIDLPKFYIDFKNDNSPDCAKDVLREIDKLKEENVEGIILDLRGNGGGSLHKTVEIGGFFIKNGPIVEIQQKGGRTKVLSDDSNTVQYNGELIILVDQTSASASEILAAAMQDYGRALIIGPKQTYGKGTVQTIYDFDQMIGNTDSPIYGAIKLTIQKFYRVNGGSTQLRGVNPDILIPNKYSYMENIGERSQKNAMPWDSIQATKYSPKVYDNLEDIKQNSISRLKKNKYLELLEEKYFWIKKINNDKKIMLNLESFQRENKELEKQREKYYFLDKYDNNLEFHLAKSDQKRIKNDESFADKIKDWNKRLKNDVYVEEAINVLFDKIKLKNEQ